MSDTYTLDDVSKHSAGKSIWLVVDKKVYDVSTYAKNHPGGAAILKGVGGKDATKEFYEAHLPTNSNVKKVLKKLLIGSIVESAKPSKKNADAKKKVREETRQKAKEEEAQKKKAEEEKQQIVQEEALVQKEADEEAQRKMHEAEEEAQLQAQMQEEAVRKQAQRQAEEEEAKKRAEDEAAAKAKTEELQRQELAKQCHLLEEAKRKAEDEVAKQKAERAKSSFTGLWMTCCRSQADKHDESGLIAQRYE